MIYKKLEVSNLKNIECQIENFCPHCNTCIDPKQIGDINNLTGIKPLKIFAIIFECTSCKRQYVCFYQYNDVTTLSTKLLFVYPHAQPQNVSKELEKFSPKFAEIYTQAQAAEKYGLTEITGVGYRKAIEFLIKDYLITFQEEKPDNIYKMFLGSAINLIKVPKIQTLAKASTWLGNDETHYQRRYENKDLNDMKKFIEALIYFIKFELFAKEAEEFTTKDK